MPVYGLRSEIISYEKNGNEIIENSPVLIRFIVKLGAGSRLKGEHSFKMGGKPGILLKSPSVGLKGFFSSWTILVQWS